MTIIKQQKFVTVFVIVVEHPISSNHQHEPLLLNIQTTRAEYPAFQRKLLVIDAAICCRHFEISHKIIQFFYLLLLSVIRLHFHLVIKRIMWDDVNARAFVRFFMQDSFGLLHLVAITIEKYLNGGVIRRCIWCKSFCWEIRTNQ